MYDVIIPLDKSHLKQLLVNIKKNSRSYKDERRRS